MPNFLSLHFVTIVLLQCCWSCVLYIFRIGEFCSCQRFFRLGGFLYLLISFKFSSAFFHLELALSNKNVILTNGKKPGFLGLKVEQK